MDRRDALKALAGVAAATGMSVTPVTTQDMGTAELVIIRTKGNPLSLATMERIKEHWQEATRGTALEDLRTVVLPPEIDVEIVRK